MKRLLYVLTGLCLLASVFTSCEKPNSTSEDGDNTATKNYTETAFGINLEMVYVEGGTFEMGATEEQGENVFDNEKPVHKVTLAGFYTGKYEVTQAQWEAVMGMTLEEQHAKGTYDEGIAGEGADYPMYYVSWEDVQAFCKKLSVATGRKYVLPTEAQWEYAARGGNKSQHYKYAGSNDIDEVAWYEYNSNNGTHPVGTKKANELGIYDMSGNVLEWCSDWYGKDYYSSSPALNPQGSETSHSRVDRGGCWGGLAGHCRVSYRCDDFSYLRSSALGFRVVCISE